MADVSLLNAEAVVGGFGASGNSAPFSLASPGGAVRVVLCVCAAASVAAAGSIQLTLAMAVGDFGLPTSWIPVVSLPVQSSAGVQQASAAVPSSVLGGMARLQWTVVGGGASIAAFATAIG